MPAGETAPAYGDTTWGEHLFSALDTLVPAPSNTFIRALRSQLVRENEAYHLAYGIAALSNPWNDREHERAGHGASVEVVTAPDVDRVLLLRDACGGCLRLVSVVVQSFTRRGEVLGGLGGPFPLSPEEVLSALALDEGHTAQIALARGLTAAVDAARAGQGGYVLAIAGTKLARLVALDVDLVVLELTPECQSHARDLSIVDLESLCSNPKLFDMFPHDLVEGIPNSLLLDTCEPPAPMAVYDADSPPRCSCTPCVREVVCTASPFTPTIQRYFDVLSAGILALGGVRRDECVGVVPLPSGARAAEVRLAAGGRIGRSMSFARFVGWHRGRGSGSGSGGAGSAGSGSRSRSRSHSRSRSSSRGRSANHLGLAMSGVEEETALASSTSRSTSRSTGRTVLGLAMSTAETSTTFETSPPSTTSTTSPSRHIPAATATQLVAALTTTDLTVVGVHPAFMDLLVRDAWGGSSASL